MPKCIGVRFSSGGKVYTFDSGDLEIGSGENVIVETARGLEFGTAASGPSDYSSGEEGSPARRVVRKATRDDERQNALNHRREAEAHAICQRKIASHGLEMKLIKTSYNFDGSKVVFFFTADGRVDFRELVKDLASTFRIRIELRQIGVRDEAKMIGGFGICGYPFCCTAYMNDFQPVSIKMAKEQGLSMNPAKISGACGRLMCCLKYEQEAYEDLQKITPKIGSLVSTEDGEGTVTDAELLSGMLKVRLEKGSDITVKQYHRSKVKLLRCAAKNQGQSRSGTNGSGK